MIYPSEWVANTHEVNVALISGAFASGAKIGFYLSLIIIAVGFLYWCWEVVDDNEKLSSIFKFAGIGIAGGVGITFLTGLFWWAMYFIVNTYSHTFYLIPWEVYTGVFTFLTIIVVARYARRTHKVIHTHVTDDKAHTPDAKPFKHKLVNPSDDFFRDM